MLNENQEFMRKYFLGANMASMPNIEFDNNDYPLDYRDYYKKQKQLFIEELGELPEQKIFTLRDLEVLTAFLFNSKVFKIQDKEKLLFLNTDIDFNIKKHLPFGSIFLDCDIQINSVLIKGLLLTDLSNEENKKNDLYYIENIKDLKVDFVMFKEDKFMSCSFFINKQDVIKGGGITEGTNELSNIYLNVDFRKKIAMFCLNFLNSLYNPEIEICCKEYTDIRKKRKAQKGKLVENHYYLKIKGRLREYIDNLDSEKFTQEYQRHTNSWIVRGYYKTLSSDYFKNMKGKEIFIPPFICGLGAPKSKTYIVGDKIVWKNQLLMIETIKKVLSDRIILENTRGILDGLELDCYIPDSRIAFEYDGKQHFELIKHFHKEEQDFKDLQKRDKEKDRLCKELGIKLIRIKYDEEISEDLIKEKLLDLNSLKIAKIENVGLCNTYDIMVEDNNNFYLANDINSENSGKSVSLLSIIQGYRDIYGYKVFDLYGGERHEHLYWSLPSQDLDYWNKLRKLGTLSEPGPKQYKVNYLYPYFKSKFPKKIPKKLPFVNSKIFTIPLKSVTKEDIAVVIGNLSESSKFVWNEILFNAKKQDNSGSLMKLVEKKKITNTPIYKNFIVPMYREGFLSDEYCDYNLDLVQECRDKEAITVLCLDFVPKDFKIFVINYVSRKLTELLDKNKVGNKNILFIREAAQFFSATDDSVKEEKYKIFRSNMSDYIRYGRRGMYFACDCQSSSETRGIISGSQDFLLMFRMTAFRDKRELCDEMVRERRMKNEQVADLAFLEKGQCYIAENGGRTVKKVQITLPRTMYWKKEYGNFYSNVWERFGGDWINTEEAIDKILERNKSREQELNNKTKKKIQAIGNVFIERQNKVFAETPVETIIVEPGKETVVIPAHPKLEVQNDNINKLEKIQINEVKLKRPRRSVL